jgi:hypothetical protein
MEWLSEEAESAKEAILRSKRDELE